MKKPESAVLVDTQKIDIQCGPDVSSLSPSYILTVLIQTAGKECSAYASDLFISWSSLLDHVKNLKDGKTYQEWFGFRDYGVDHETFIDSRTNNGKIGYGEFYSSVYVVDVCRDGNDVCYSLYLVYASPAWVRR